MQVKMAGTPMNLVGTVPAVGGTIPSFSVVAGDLSAVTQGDLKGTRVFITVPSIDTPVCDTEVRRFNQEAAALGNVSINVISMDLPFAKARWCGAAGIEAVKLYSDYKDRAFGKAFGVMIEELGLLARAIFIVDEKDVVRYVQIVDEVTSEPNYDEVLNTLKAL